MLEYTHNYMNSTTSLETLGTTTQATITQATIEATQTVAQTAAPQFGLESFIPQQYLNTLGFLNSTGFFGNTILQYSFALITIFLAYIFLPIFWAIVVRYFQTFTDTVLPSLSETIRAQLSKFNKKIFLIVAVYIGCLTINLPESFTSTLKGLVIALLAIQIAIIIAPLIEPLLKSIPALNKPELKPITARLVIFAKTALWAIVGIFGLSSLGVNTGPLLASFGVLGLGGALAFQQMVPGFIKVLGFHFSKNFSLGDKISAGTHQGIVEEIDITTTKIKQVSGEIVEVKNEELMSAIVIPQDGPHFISDTIKINLHITNDLQIFSNIENIFKNCLVGIQDTNFDKVLFTEFNGPGVLADLNYSVLIDKKIENKHQILLKLISEFKSKNISFTGK